MPFLPPSSVKDLFNYDPHTGLLTWAVKTKHTAIGDEAGSVTRRGRVIVTIKGEKIYGEEICYMLMHGAWPTTPIHFRNGNSNDLRWDNLFEFTGSRYSENPKAVAMRELRERKRQKERAERAAAAAREMAELRDQYPTIGWNAEEQVFKVCEPHDLPFRLPAFRHPRRGVGQAETFEEAILLYEDHLQRLDILCNVPRTPLPEGVDQTTPSARGYYRITLAELYDLLYYDAETGIFIWNKVPNLVGLRADRPMTPNSDRSARYVSVRGRQFTAHQLAWFMTYYEWPPAKSIKWANGNCGDNSIRNLFMDGDDVARSD